MNSSAILTFIIIFQNLYNPVSPYLTLGLNISLAFIFFLKKPIKIEKFIATITILILIWYLFVSIVRGVEYFDIQTMLKYFRSAISTILLLALISAIKITHQKLISILSIIFALHISSIFLQLVIPQLDIPMAKLFGFSRDESIISNYSIRKLGLSSSYDTASLFSIAALLFYYLCFVGKKENRYLVLFVMAFIASFFSSRTGMIIGLLIFIPLMVKFILQLKKRNSLILILILLPSSFLTYTYLYPIFNPIIMQSFGADHILDDNLIGNYGNTGTIDALFGSHLLPLNQPFFDLLLGFSIDPNTLGFPTDIGYIKLIYHIGIIGLAMILIMYFYMLRKAFIAKHASTQNYYSTILANFTASFIIILFFFNYKSLEMYSRGAHDLLIILFIFLMNKTPLHHKIFNYKQPILRN